MGETSRDEGGDDTVMVEEGGFGALGEERANFEIEEEREDMGQEEKDVMRGQLIRFLSWHWGLSLVGGKILWVALGTW